MKFLLLLVVIFSQVNFAVYAQSSPQKKILNATRLNEAPTIDGYGNDEVWQALDWGFEGEFVQLMPDNLEPSAYTSHIKFAYTDKGLYVFAQLDDPNPNNIARELGLRDDFSRNADRFAIILDTYNQGQNANYFGVNAAGVQLDLYNSGNNEDTSWDAVYATAVQITDAGWQVEMEIPWSMLRFSRQSQAVWGLNIVRETRSKGREVALWNPVNAEIAGLINQSGQLVGIENINPPLRLQLYPYLNATAGKDGVSGQTNTNFGGGMDIKWGISESFTLDMTLIPDFSQVQADNQVLNLSPFEVQYAENRPFFTEGTELFDRGNIFYSRRVGQVNYAFADQVPDSVEIISTPTAAKLVNAFKITGRTPKGLGIGVFNATTNEVISDAILSGNANLSEYPDSTLQNSIQYVMDPLTNYNMVVLDQNLKNNSNISVWNTNVNRASGAQDANVTGVDFQLREKGNKYQITGFGAQSIQYDSEGLSNFTPNKRGYRYRLAFEKVSGNLQYGIFRNVESEHYDINDLGILFFPNEVNHGTFVSYQVFKPFWNLNNFGSSLNVNYNRLKVPSEYGQFSANINLWGQFKNFWNFSVGRWQAPVSSFDFTESRTWGYKFERLKSWNNFIWVGTNQQKRFYTGINLWNFRRPAWNAYDWGMYLSPRYRVSNKLSISAGFGYTRVTNERGYALTLRDDSDKVKYIIFGDRDYKQIEPELFVEYTMNNRMGLNARLRLYRNRLAYNNQELYQLHKNGETKLLSQEFVAENDIDAVARNQDFTTLNMELLYRWQIAPGSFVTASYKGYTNNLFADGRYQARNIDFSNNRFARLQPMQQTVSLKITYFVDYLSMKDMLTALK